MKVCAESGCPELTSGTRCALHTHAKDRARGTREERGYGKTHKALRKRWAAVVAKGQTNCWRCGERLSPLAPWDLGHRDDRSGYAGPECLPCNRSTSARRVVGGDSLLSVSRTPRWRTETSGARIGGSFWGSDG